MEEIMKELYPYIFKRKSFHLFRDNKTRTYYKDFNSLSQNELDEVYKIFKSIKPLFDDIRIDIRIEKTSSTRGEEYSILFYRYKKPGKRGIMPVEKVIYQNLIDMGIFILFLSILFEYNNIKFTLKPYNDNENNLDEYNHSFDVIIDD